MAIKFIIQVEKLLKAFHNILAIMLRHEIHKYGEYNDILPVPRGLWSKKTSPRLVPIP